MKSLNIFKNQINFTKGIFSERIEPLLEISKLNELKYDNYNNEADSCFVDILTNPIFPNLSTLVSKALTTIDLNTFQEKELVFHKLVSLCLKHHTFKGESIN